MLDSLVCVSTLVRGIVLVTQVYFACFGIFIGFQTWVDLVILDMFDFDIILLNCPYIMLL